MSAHDKQLVKGKHFIDGFTALVADRRATMRAAETSFTTATGRPWSALRYFSYEEDADDVSVQVLRAAGLDPAGEGGFLLAALGDLRVRCEAILDAGEVPPYGANYADEHHATCWRVYHVRQLAKLGKVAARPVPAPAVEHAPRLPLSTVQLAPARRRG
jgi:hypothetical protein